MRNTKKYNSVLTRIIILFILIIFSLVLGAMWIYANYGMIQADATYYIGISNAILNGMVPYKDFVLEYTPLSFYFMCIPTYLFNNSYTIDILFLYLFHVLNAILVFFICIRHNKTKFISCFTALFSLTLCYYLGGEVYILEPFVLFLGLTAIYCITYNKTLNYFVAGILCFCSFWTKQYGVGFIFLCVVYWIMAFNGKYRNTKLIIYLILGFIAGLLLAILCMYLQNIDIITAFKMISGSNYERKGSFLGVMSVWRTLLSIVPFFIFSIILFVMNIKKSISNKMLVVSICGILGFSLQWYIRTYWHYLILLVPFYVIFILESIENIKSKKWKFIFLICFVLSIFRPLCALLSNRISIYNNKPRQEQEAYAKKIRGIISDNKNNVYAAGDAMPINLINQYWPPLIKKYGFSNGFVETTEGTYEMIASADYCIISNQVFNHDKRFTPEICCYLDNNFSKQIIQLSGTETVFYIFQRIKE